MLLYGMLQVPFAQSEARSGEKHPDLRVQIGRAEEPMQTECPKHTYPLLEMQ